MNDFTLRRAEEVLSLLARSDRAKARIVQLPQAKNAPGTDRLLLKGDQAREVLALLKFEGYGIQGEELI